MGGNVGSQFEAGALLKAARDVRRHAYAPYSGFAVGAALLDADGRIHTGVNVENVSYGMTICAERSALSRAVGEGVRSFAAIAIAGPDSDVPCWPCGACRQVLLELAPTLWVVVDGPQDRPLVISLAALLPEPFRAGSPGALPR
jgi:cytidine deaminase